MRVVTPHPIIDGATQDTAALAWAVHPKRIPVPIATARLTHEYHVTPMCGGETELS